MSYTKEFVGIKEWVYCPLCQKAYDVDTVEILEKLEHHSSSSASVAHDVVFICPKCKLDCSSKIKIREIWKSKE